MRVGLVCPYSYTYPGGVLQHVDALADELIRQGHQVRLLAPYDPDDWWARITHRGLRPQRRPIPEHLIPLGRTVALPSNGAISNLSLAPSVAARLYLELRSGDYDVVHVHEPNAPLVSWCATESARAATVGTFHCYSTSVLTNGAARLIGARRLYNKLHVRLAVSQAARWTCERFYGGNYRLVPNGVDLQAASTGTSSCSGDGPDRPFRIVFVGRADERKGLPVLLGAFEGLRAAGIGVELTIVGASPDEVAPLVLDSEGIDVAGRVTEAQKWRLLGEADLLCAPSLGAESFGMVLTEAFAAGTPVIASDIAGYRDVVSDQTDGILVPPGDATALAKAINSLASDPQRRENMAQNARERAKRFSWPQVAAEIVDAYETALTLRKPRNAMQKILLRTGLTPADGGPRKPPRRLESMEQPVPGQRRTRTLALVRKAALVCGTIGGFTLTGLALERIGIGPIVGALLAAAPVWVLLAFGLMCASMLVRAESWHAILRAALPQVSIRRADAVRGTMIGVLMSATLPARLGEVSRAVVVARRLGSVRENLPLVAGTLISQTLFNILALFLLGAATFTSVGLFHGHEAAVALVALVPLSLFLILLVAPGLLGRGIGARYAPLAVAARRIRRASQDARVGLKVFRNPRLGGWAVVSQLFAWVVQWMACYLLLVALGLNAHAGLGAAAAVLFAVNVTAAIPATPSNIGVFQAACIAVLSAYGIAKTDAFAFGIILQAVEVATAFTVGMPAFVREGMSWKDLRARALHAAPVEVTALSPHSGPADV